MPSDITPFAAPRNRFDTSEFCCFFGDTLRRMRTLQSVRAAFDRPGFQRDLHLISNLTADDFVQASRPDIPKTNMSEGRLRAHKALQHLQFATALVPMTNGYKMRLKHVGHSFTKRWGPLHLFTTSNFADCWNPLVVGIFESVSKSGIRTSDGTLKAITHPEMPTLQRMHAITAESPRTTMKFHLLQEELSYRHLFEIDRVHRGKFQVTGPYGRFDREDGFATSGRIGLAGCAVASLQPDEAHIPLFFL